MKKLSLLAILFSALLSGCVVYDPQLRDNGRDRDRDRDRDGRPDHMERDLDHDSSRMPNSHMVRPEDSRHY